MPLLIKFWGDINIKEHLWGVGAGCGGMGWGGGWG